MQFTCFNCFTQEAKKPLGNTGTNVITYNFSSILLSYTFHIIQQHPPTSLHNDITRHKIQYRDTPPMSAIHAQPQEQSGTGFLDLSPELRNNIYALWAKDVLHVGIRAKGKAYTTAAHPGTKLSRLVHREFNGVIGSNSALHAQSVKVQIVDLNFVSTRKHRDLGRHWLTVNGIRS